jgi:hypothetical protein
MNVVALPGRRIETEAWLKSLLEAAECPDAKVTGVGLYAITYDGFITVAGVKYDAIIVHAAEREKGEAYQLEQRFRPAGAGTPFEVVGRPAYVGREPAFFRNAP